MKVSHKPVKGTPMPKGGHSTMEKEKGKHEITQPGSKKFGSNSMSPCAKEGKINDYGK